VTLGDVTDPVGSDPAIDFFSNNEDLRVVRMAPRSDRREQAGKRGSCQLGELEG
jgi:hypothetical protein